jgi:uncharacterized protein YkwD
MFKSKILIPVVVMTIVMGWGNSQVSSQTMPAVSIPQLGQENFSIMTVGTVQSDQEIAALEQSAYELVNQYRASLNLGTLKFNPQISQQARIHSENMAKHIVEFSHDGFDGRIETLEAQIVYLSAAENVAYTMGYDDPANKAVEEWLKSDDHRQNIEGDYNLTGIGVAKNQQGEYYFTQIFIWEN